MSHWSFCNLVLSVFPTEPEVPLCSRSLPPSSPTVWHRRRRFPPRSSTLRVAPLPPQRRRPLPSAGLNLRRRLPRRRDRAASAGRMHGAAAGGRQARSSGGGKVAARGRRAPTCSSNRSRTPPPSTPTSRHLMCTLGRPVRRTANETMPNIVSVLTFCNQATALLQQQQKEELEQLCLPDEI
ncbi:serine/arginine-rich splicing factor SR45 isoform X2 [Triticum aestivum]|uniref:serine/arginine-rich splicing factor SR45 isoform X2 n=1 Tax=Triticum aestivum TaxID=4565 RepID=UPI001D029AA8|nr:serine/arginine-rich splicing factor SR45-like isoform X2 [Triticum aestivum]